MWPSSLRKEAQQSSPRAPTFRLMSIVAKRWPISATAELLLLSCNCQRRCVSCKSTVRLWQSVFSYRTCPAPTTHSSCTAVMPTPYVTSLFHCFTSRTRTSWMVAIRAGPGRAGPDRSGPFTSVSCTRVQQAHVCTNVNVSTEVLKNRFVREKNQKTPDFRQANTSNLKGHKQRNVLSFICIHRMKWRHSILCGHITISGLWDNTSHCVKLWFVALFEQNWISWFKKMSVLSLSYWESDVTTTNISQSLQKKLGHRYPIFNGWTLSTLST